MGLLDHRTVCADATCKVVGYQERVHGLDEQLGMRGGATMHDQWTCKRKQKNSKFISSFACMGEGRRGREARVTG